jgi:hypothetical protein
MNENSFFDLIFNALVKLRAWAVSSDWLERCVDIAEVIGSNPIPPTIPQNMRIYPLFHFDNIPAPQYD